MNADEEVKQYLSSFGAAVPAGWRLWWDRHNKRYLVISLDKEGREFGHMIDDNDFADRVVKYLLAQEVRVVGDEDQSV